MTAAAACPSSTNSAAFAVRPLPAFRATATIMGMVAEPEAASVASSSRDGAAAAAGAPGTAGATASTRPSAPRPGGRSGGKRRFQNGRRNLPDNVRAQIRSKIALSKISAMRQDDWR